MLYRRRALSCISFGLSFHHKAKEGIITRAGNQGYGFVREELTKKSYMFQSPNFTHNHINSKVTFEVGAVNVQLVPNSTVKRQRQPMTNRTPALPPCLAYGKRFLVYTKHPHKKLGLTLIGDDWYFLKQAPPSPLPRGTMHCGKHVTVCMLDSFCAEPEEDAQTLGRLKALVRHIVEVDQENSYSMCEDVSYAAPRAGRCIYYALWEVLNELSTPLQRLRQGTDGMKPLIPFFEQKYARNLRDVYHYLYDADPAAIPLVVGFLRDEIRWRRATASSLPRSPDSSATEKQLREYITNVIDKKETKNCAAVVDAIIDDVVSLRKSIPSRAEVLFATTIRELLESCACIVYPDDDDARRQQVSDILDAMKKHDGNPFGNLLKDTEKENPTTIPDDAKVTYEKLITEKWTEDFELLDAIGDSNVGFIILRVTNKKAKVEKEVNLQFRKQQLKIIIVGASYVPDFDVTKQSMSDLRRLLMSIALPCPPRPQKPEFKNLCPFIEYTHDAVGVVGEIGPKNMQPPAKKSLTIITGASGSGKTTYAQFTLPRREWGFRDAVVLTVTLSDQSDPSPVDANKDAVEKNEHEYRKKQLSIRRDERLRRMFALAALRRREDSFPDETQYVSWREYCIEQIGCQDRDQAACKYVIDNLKSALKGCSVGYDETWFECDDVGENKIKEPVVFIVDEIGKSLPLARAIVSAQLRIYTHPWVQSHLTTLNLVLCGTGAEMAHSGAEMAHSGADTDAVATDPSAFHQLEVRAPTDEFVSKALAGALLCNPKNLKDTIPLLYKQEQHMPLYAAAKTNMRLLMLVCKLINMMWSEVLPSDSKEKAIEGGSDISSRGSLSELIARADAVFAESIGLDGFVAVALLAYLQHNGLQRLGENAKKVADATLVAALGVCSSPSSLSSPKCTLLPLAPLRDQNALLDRASTLGLVVRHSGTLPSPAITAVVTFAFNKPGTELDGYALETFTARWASRLVRAQCGFTSGVRQLPFQVPWDEIPPRAADVGELLEALRTDKVLVLLNGARAAGADVIVLQLRPDYDDVKEYMTQDTYDALWPDGVVASMTLVSDKRRKAEVQDQLAKMGVLRGDAMRELGPVFLAWLCAKASVNNSDTHDLVMDDDYDELLEHYTEKVKVLLCGGKIIVRPRLVYGADSLHDNMDENTLEYIWEDKGRNKEDVWAVGEERLYGLCPPETFGPLSNMVWARPFKQQ